MKELATHIRFEATILHANARAYAPANTYTSRILLALPRAAGCRLAHAYAHTRARAHTHTHTDTQANRFALTLEEEIRVMRQVTTRARALACVDTKPVRADARACVRACMSVCVHACACMNADAKPARECVCESAGAKPSLTIEFACASKCSHACVYTCAAAQPVRKTRVRKRVCVTEYSSVRIRVSACLRLHECKCKTRTRMRVRVCQSAFMRAPT